MSNIDDVAEQIRAGNAVRDALNDISLKLDNNTKTYLKHIYSSTQLRSIYEAMRNEAQLNNKLKSNGNQKLAVKFPSGVVYKFINDTLTPKYGKEWITDKTIFAKVLKQEDIIKPWIIGGA